MKGFTAVVLSGGGAKGAFELGALDYLVREANVDPDVLTGVSTGALNAAALAQGKGRAGLLEQLDILTGVWMGLKSDKDIYKRRLLGIFGPLFKADSIYNNKPAWKLIKTHISRYKLVDSQRQLRIGVAELGSGRFVSFNGCDPDILEAIRASVSIPVLFEPVKICGKRCVDGGVINVTPLKMAFRALAEFDRPTRSRDTIYVILASPPALERTKDLNSGISIAKRTLSMLVNEVYRTDLTHALAINEVIGREEVLRRITGEEIDSLFPDYRYANVVLIRPAVSYLESLTFDPKKIRLAFSRGRVAAKRAVVDAAGTGTNITRETLTNWGV